MRRVEDWHTPLCSEPVTGISSVQDWDALTFLHWSVDAAVVQRLLPPGLEVDVCRGSAWVGLVPFLMRIHLGPLPPLPVVTCFAETNVRTYVKGPDGRAGLLFLSLDVPRLSLVLGVRATVRMPYVWSDMSVQAGENRVRYRSRRRWPQRPTASSITVEIGDHIPSSELEELDHFLSARWGLYTWMLGGLAYLPVEHPPWMLQRARVVDLKENLIVAAGLPTPQDPPLVHYSAHMRARLGIPRLIAQQRHAKSAV